MLVSAWVGVSRLGRSWVRRGTVAPGVELFARLRGASRFTIHDKLKKYGPIGDPGADGE